MPASEISCSVPCYPIHHVSTPLQPAEQPPSIFSYKVDREDVFRHRRATVQLVRPASRVSELVVPGSSVDRARPDGVEAGARGVDGRRVVDTASGVAAPVISIGTAGRGGGRGGGRRRGSCHLSCAVLGQCLVGKSILARREPGSDGIGAGRWRWRWRCRRNGTKKKRWRKRYAVGRARRVCRCGYRRGGGTRGRLLPPGILGVSSRTRVGGTVRLRYLYFFLLVYPFFLCISDHICFTTGPIIHSPSMHLQIHIYISLCICLSLSLSIYTCFCAYVYVGVC